MGSTNTPVTSCASVALGSHVPILLVPAMHGTMGENPAVREAFSRLRGWGVHVLFGLATEGEAKLASPEEVAAAVLHRLARGPWAGRRVVVIGGASRESIDAVRSVTNESSGGTAVALANQAHFRGATVELWSGALSVPVPPWVEQFPWRSVGDLSRLAKRRATSLRAAAAVFVPAALSDYTLEPIPGKIPSRERPTLRLTLTPARKLLPELRRLAPAPTRLVAFKLLAGESPEALEREGRRLQEESGADWVVANDATTVGALESSVLALPRSEPRRWLRGPKAEVAGKLLDDLGRELADGPRPAVAPGPTGRPSSAHRRRRARRPTGPTASPGTARVPVRRRR